MTDRPTEKLIMATAVLKLDGEITEAMLHDIPRYVVMEEPRGARVIHVVKVPGHMGRDGWRVRLVPDPYSNHSTVRAACARLRKLRIDTRNTKHQARNTRQQ